MVEPLGLSYKRRNRKHGRRPFPLYAELKHITIAPHTIDDCAECYGIPQLLYYIDTDGIARCEHRRETRND
jgi:hypothetical protein